MPDHPLRRVLSRIVRVSPDPSRYELVFIHRGAEHDQMTIDMSMVASVAKGSFLLRDGETQIPFHRVLRIRKLDDGSLLWEKRVAKSSRVLQC